MEIKELKISEIETNKGQLKGLPKNPRLIKDDRFKKLVDSLRESKDFLKIREIVVFPLSENKYITIAGNQRLSALKELGEKTVTCKILPLNTTIEKLKEFTIKDNVSYGEMDWEVVNTEWDITEVESWGEEKEDAKKNKKEKKEKELKEEITSIKTNVKEGDLFEIGRHRIMCGSCTDFVNIDKLMNGNKATTIFTDPPYDFENDKEYASILKDYSKDANIFVMHDDKGILSYLKASELEFKRFYVSDFGFASPRGNDPYLSHILVSQEINGKAKKHKNLADGFRSIIKMEYRHTLKDEKTLHKHQKSIDFVSLFLKHFDDDNANVLDIFLGSGTTVLCAELNNMNGFGIDLMPQAVHTSILRLLSHDKTLKVVKNGIDETDLWIKELDKNGSKD